VTDAVLDIRVIPRARKTELAGERNGAVVVRLAAPPVEGAANEALIDLLALTLDLPRRNIRLVAGAHGRRKRVAISGMTIDQVRAILRR
jgi:uncharacterized protein (TIGR00251 family)